MDLFPGFLLVYLFILVTVVHYFKNCVTKALMSSRTSFPILLFFFEIILDIHIFETIDGILIEVVLSL